MSEVDDRIVSIEFDNANFERRMSQTLASLDKLSESLRFNGAERGFDNISRAANNFDTSRMANGIDHIASKFTALGAIGFTAIQRLTGAVFDFTKKIGGDILDPILSGGKQRALNLEQAKFLFQGVGIDIEKGMDSALKAVKGTAFGLDEAAKSAAQFGASGIKVGDEMTGALRGVAGVAALTGRSFSEIGDIFASSAATGVVNNQDLLQFATRGLNAAAALAKQMGITEAKVHELASEGKISFKDFAHAMDAAFGKHAKDANQTYAGSLSNLHAAMSRLGASIISPKLTQQRDLFNALTPAIDSVSAGLQPLIADFIAFRRIHTDNLIKLINKLDFTSFQTGVGNLAVAGVNLYKAFKPIGTVFKEAFHEIFSGSLGKNFVRITESFKDFTAKIKISAGVIHGFHAVFKGFFGAIEIGFTIFKEVLKTIGAVVEAIFPAGVGFVKLGTSTGDFLVNLNKALVAGGGITRFFNGLRDVLIHPVDSLIKLKDAFLEFITGVNLASHGPLKALQDLRDRIFAFFNIKPHDVIEKSLGRVGQRLNEVHDIWEKVQLAFTKVHNFLQPVLDYMTNWLKELGHKLAAAFHPGDFNALLDVLNVGLLGGIVALLHNFAKNGLKLNLVGTFKPIQSALNNLTNTLHAMQTQLKAQAILKIAFAVGILTVSLVALSLIDSAKLTKALFALSVSFGQLIGALTLLDKINFKSSVVKLNGIAAAMILIAGAAVILSIAIKILSTMKLGDLAKGLLGVAVGLSVLVESVNAISENTTGLVRAGIAMIALSTGLVILAAAVKIFATLKFGDMIKGLAGVALGLLVVTSAMNAMPPSSVLSGAGFIEVAIGLNILAGAVKLFSLIKGGDIAKGILSIAVALGLIAAAMQLMPINLPITAAGVLVLSVALGIMAGAVKLMGSIKFGDLAKGIGAFAAMLLILAVAVNAMNGAVLGAAALLIVAHGLSILAKVLVDLSALSFGDLLHGLAAIAAVLVVLGVAAALLAPVIPEMLALGIALGVIGASFALFGAGAILVAKSFEIMGKSGAAGAKGIVDALKIVETALPDIEKAVANAAIDFAEDLLRTAPLLLRLFEALISQLLKTVRDLAPQIVKTIGVLIDNLVKLIHLKSPSFIKAGFELLLNFLIGMRDNIAPIVEVVSEIIVNFLNALSDHLDEIVTAAANLIVTFIEELGNHEQEIIKAGADLIIKYISGIGKNINRIITAAVNVVISFVRSIARNAGRIVAAGAQIVVNFLTGLSSHINDVIDAASNVITSFLNSIDRNLSRVVNKGADVIIHLCNGLKKRGPEVVKAITGAGVAILSSILDAVSSATVSLGNKFLTTVIAILNGLANAIRANASRMGEAWANLGEAMVSGLGKAMLAAMRKVILDATPKLLRRFVKSALDALGIKSPSKVFMYIGAQVIAGFAKGISDNAEQPINALDAGNKRIITRMSETVSQISDALDSNLDFQPTITPVLDLTGFKKSAGGISEIIKTPKLVPEVSLGTARLISVAAQENAVASPPVDTLPPSLTFEQNNYSPAALSTNDIYRQTKSQIALAKEKLGVS